MNAPPNNRVKRRAVVLVLLFAATLQMGAQDSPDGRAPAPPPPGMVLIHKGAYTPLFRGQNDPKAISVRAFYLDIYPVANNDFLEFVRANPQWRRSQVKRWLADEAYLQHWQGDLEPGANAASNAPVTRVSWFAANAYATWRAKRLASTAEWERAAAASVTRPDGEKDSEFQKQILKWYASPSPRTLPNVGAGQANYWGAYDLHGLVWEWVLEVNTATGTGDARADTGRELEQFCGGGSQGAGDRGDYPAFMRLGFRSSLKASYTVHNLGFRCARDL